MVILIYAAFSASQSAAFCGILVQLAHPHLLSVLNLRGTKGSGRPYMYI